VGPEIYLPPGGGRLIRRLALLAAAGVTVLAGLAVLTAVVVATAGGGSGAAAAIALAANSQSSCVAPAAAQGSWQQWSAEQVTDAATIVRTGQAASVPQYGLIIAVATAMQESQLVNLPYGDRDSLGLFQQRPSQGWGTPAQIMDPVYAAGQFYRRLLQVPSWQNLPLTVAAQDVQHSGAPAAYAKWQQPAAELVAHLTGTGTATLLAASVAVAGSCGPGQVPAGTPATARAVIGWAKAQIGTIYEYGGSCTDPHSPDMSLHCDCSSLVQQAFAHGAGITLPRTAQQQWEYGEAGHAQVIPPSRSQPGDVVYFPSYLGPNIEGHTGIITDPATMTMINAPETGKPVGFASYNPAGLPFGTHLFTILRFISTTGSKS
jgi:cell wall-associated NlpC family hydrolase